MIDFLVRDRPGRSAARQYSRLARRWRRRVFGRRAAVYAYVILAILLLLMVGLHLRSRWALMAGIAFGMVVMAVHMIPESLMPGHIARWQVGAWGEQNTAFELRALRREGWVVRHDVRWSERGNHDHVVAGRAVYVLNTKNVKDSRVTIEGKGLRVEQLENPSDGYLADRWALSAAGEAGSLQRELEHALGFPVAVYPLLVVLAEFTAKPQWIGNVCVVHGECVADFIRSRPTDLVDEKKRQAVTDYVRSMPRAI